MNSNATQDAPSPDELQRLRNRVAVLETENLSLAKGLRVADARFHDLADNSRGVVSIVNATCARQHYVSPAYETIFERSRESLYTNPQSWLEAVHPDDRERVEKALQSAETFNEEFRILRSNGEVRWVRTRFTPIRNEANEMLRLVSYTEDIGDWKRMESQLIQSQKMDAVGRLAGGIAHDFNNLLTVINGYSALLMERLDLAEEIREDLASIQRAGDRAASLTAQLLSFSRKNLAQPVTIELVHSLAAVEPMLRRLIRENVELVTVAHQPSIHTKFDPTQFEQVIMNLVINARDAIETAGTITIELDTCEFDAETSRLHGNVPFGHYAMIAVSDTGRGMSPQVQEKIFEPFFTTKELGQGTGLGLATVYGLVKQASGTIWVYSEESVGTTIRLYLPVSEHAAPAEPKGPIAASRHGSGTILLVEDDPAVRAIASDVLQKRGYTVIAAAHGEEAIRLAEACLFIDLLVTDVVMPKMGGNDLADRLIARYPNLKVLFISGYTETAAVQLTGLAAGSNHLAKPFSPDALALKVAQVLVGKAMTA